MGLNNGAFVNRDSYTFVPALGLCYCDSRLGDDVCAYYYHKISKKFKPDNEKVKHNDLYFNKIFNMKKQS